MTNEQRKALISEILSGDATRDPYVVLQECAEVIYTQAELLKACEWQPIESAPKDKPILVFQGKEGDTLYVDIGRIGVVQWDCNGFGTGYGWMAFDCCDGVTRYDPTHWMPLPKPPTAQGA